MALHPLPDPPPYTPTPIERTLYAALDRAAITFQPQKPFGWWTVDAYLPPPYHVAIEADGCHYHACARCAGEWPSPDGIPAAEVRAKSARRDRDLLRRWGIRVLHIYGHDLRDEQQAFLAVHDALATLNPTRNERK